MTESSHHPEGDPVRPISADIRRRVLAACDAGDRTRAVAARFVVSESWVRRLKQRRRATGETAPRVPGRRPPALAAPADAIRRAVADTPDATLAELKARLGLAASLATLGRAVRALGLTVKKSPPGGRAGPPGRSRRPGLVAGRAAGRGPGPGGVRGRDVGEHPDDPPAGP